MFLSTKRSTCRTLALIGTLLASSAPMWVMAWEDDIRRIDVVEKTADHPFQFHAIGLPTSVLNRLAALEPTDPEFARVFTVTVVSDPADKSIPPVSGKYRVDGERLVFVPRFPSQAGLTYRAVILGETRIARDVLIPKPAEDATRAPTQVRSIYPTTDVLPENHLRFYIHFTQPMSRTAAYENLELLDEKGQTVEAAFLELGEELWDPTSQRFTLLLDPGRIKRGLKPREEEGPILELGHKYTLVVKRTWRDARGNPLKSDSRKPFTAGPPRDKPLDVAEWKLNTPAADTLGLLSVDLPYPLDHALLDRLLTVIDADGHAVQGKHVVCNAERKWTFQPDEKWQPRPHQLVIDTVLEDSAGNRIGRAFEVDEQETVTRQVVPEYVKIPFEVTRKEAVATKP